MSDNEFMPPSTMIDSMRDSGFKNSAYALAELIDNSIQAGSSEVHVLCVTDHVQKMARSTEEIVRLYVVDNGEGMDSNTLRRSIAFATGSRLNDRSGIGRFGMGLPNSSISQALRFDVHSWQSGTDNCLTTYADINEIKKGAYGRTVPEPSQEPLPPEVCNAIPNLNQWQSGTIVAWSSLDRMKWKKAGTLFNHCENLIGRLYRKFLASGKVSIHFTSFKSGNPTATDSRTCLPNDPLYLLEGTNCPEWGDPPSDAPMFEEYDSNSWGVVLEDEKEYRIEAKTTLVKPGVRDQLGKGGGGSSPQGTHAKKNVGVSIVRAGRELILQTGWANMHDTRERWWGAEISFPAIFDEVFQVPNNKQDAPGLNMFISLDGQEIAESEGFDTVPEMVESWKKNKDYRYLLLEVSQWLKKSLKNMRDLIVKRAQAKTAKTGRHTTSSAIEAATRATAERKEQTPGLSDRDENLSDSERIESLKTGLVLDGIEESEESALEHAREIVEHKQKFDIYSDELDGKYFFTVRRRAGVILVGLNDRHPIHQKLITLLDGSSKEIPELEGLSAEDKLELANEGLRTLILSWARLEDECVDDEERGDLMRSIRSDWGIIAKQFYEADTEGQAELEGQS